MNINNTGRQVSSSAKKARKRGKKQAAEPELAVKPRRSEHLPLIFIGMALVLILAGFGLFQYFKDEQAAREELQPYAPVLETATLTINEKQLTAELAITRPDMERGLMFREGLLPDHGMLFVYDQPRVLRFYMKNTLIPLSIAFIDSGQRIISIHKMEPLDTEPRYYPPRPAHFALEMTQGWFADHNIQPGDRVEMPAHVLSEAGLAPRPTPTPGDASRTPQQ